MKNAERRKGLRAKKRGYVSPQLRKQGSLRNITAQGTSRSTAPF